MRVPQLAIAFGIPKARRDAFAKALQRARRSLGAGFLEVAEPRPNASKYESRADSEAVKSLAAQYRQ